MVSDVALHVVNAKNDWVVKFNPDGTIEINPEYTKEEAARQFVAIACELYSEEHRSLREKLAKAEAALAQEKAEAVRVKVKPLEWTETYRKGNDYILDASSEIGGYRVTSRIEINGREYGPTWKAAHLNGERKSSSVEEAKDAAQADYEQRILSGIETLAAEPDGFMVGQHVEKITGYKWPGEVRSIFTTREGNTRVVVECTVPEVSGALHIYAPEQIAAAPKPKQEAGDAS